MGLGCGADGGVPSLASLVFTVSGDGATFSATEVQYVETVGPDGGSVPVDMGGDLIGQCTRNGAEAGSGSGSGGGAYP
jgi:hypothetical protein